MMYQQNHQRCIHIVNAQHLFPLSSPLKQEGSSHSRSQALRRCQWTRQPVYGLPPRPRRACWCMRWDRPVDHRGNGQVGAVWIQATIIDWSFVSCLHDWLSSWFTNQGDSHKPEITVQMRLLEAGNDKDRVVG